MEALWLKPECWIREMQEIFPEGDRPAYTTVQTTVYRLEAKGSIRRTRKLGNFHLFEAIMTRDTAQGRLVDELLALFGGRSQGVMAQLIEAGKLTLADVKEAGQALHRLADKVEPAKAARKNLP